MLLGFFFFFFSVSDNKVHLSILKHFQKNIHQFIFKQVKTSRTFHISLYTQSDLLHYLHNTDNDNLFIYTVIL